MGALLISGAFLTLRLLHAHPKTIGSADVRGNGWALKCFNGLFGW